MQKIIIHYLAGSRENQVEEFPITVQQEMIVGRDAAAHIKFDAERDDLVSRQHSKIIQNPWDKSGFQLVDLQSRNGTFLNRQRVYGAVRLNHGDLVQLGAGGPEFRFEIDPPPPPGLMTNAGGMLGSQAKPTRESWMPDPHGAPRPIGRGTVERMLGDVFTRVKKDHKYSRSVVAAALGVVILLGAGVWFYLQRSQAKLEASVNQSTKQSQEELAHVNDELKKGPAALEEARQQVDRLEAELKKSQNRNDANVQALLKELQAQRRQTAQLEKAFAQQKVSQAADTSFDSMAAKVRTLIDSEHPDEAAGLARQLVQMDATRWEGYALAGESAQKVNDFALAADMYRKAVSKAPADMRTHLEEQARRMQEKAGK